MRPFAFAPLLGGEMAGTYCNKGKDVKFGEMS